MNSSPLQNSVFSTLIAFVIVGSLLSGIGYKLVSFSKDDLISEAPLPAFEVDPRLRIYRPQKVSKGLTLIPFSGNERVKLVDEHGFTVHQWKTDAVRARLLKSGNLLVVHGSKWGRKQEKWSKLRNRVSEYDWSGQEIWSYQLSDSFAHHDVRRLASGNTLILKRTLVPSEKKEKITDPRRRKVDVRSDSLLEVDPNGNIVWSWHAHDHFNINECGRRNCLKKVYTQNTHDWTHTNTAFVIPENRWYRAGHTQFMPGNIMIIPRNWSMVMIIDRQSGAIVWQYAGDYKGGLDAPHEAQLIEEGFPGAGNVLIFDNGVKTHGKESYILEINPLTKKVVWVYDVGEKFHSLRRGAVQRLQNGNTLISEDLKGRCFEVTPQGQTVWLYQDEYGMNRCQRYQREYLQESGLF